MNFVSMVSRFCSSIGVINLFGIGFYEQIVYYAQKVLQIHSTKKFSNLVSLLIRKKTRFQADF